MGKKLVRLAEIRRDWDSRAEVIREARAEGEKWEDIAEAIGLSRVTVITLAKNV